MGRERDQHGRCAGEFSGAKLLWLLLAFLSCVVLNSCISQVEPFFPTFAIENYGANDFDIGLVVALMPVAYAAVSQLITKCYACISHLLMVSSGLAILSASMVLFPFSGTLGLAALARCFQGVGAAAITNPIVALNALLFPNHMSTVRGLMEASSGLGYMIGPVLGGLVEQTAGYKLIFIASGGLSGAVTATFAVFQMSTGGRIQEEQRQATSRQAEAARRAVGHRAEPCRVDKLPIVIHCCSTVLSSMGYTYLGPILAEELHKVLNTGALVTGAVFAIGATVYLCMAPIVGILADNVTGNRPLICMGFFISSFSLMLMGPAPMFPIEGSTCQWAYKTVGLALLGMGNALIAVPLVPDMLLGESLAQGAQDRVVGLWGSMFSTGMCLGPLCSGFLTQVFGFRAACITAGAVLGCWAAILWVLAISGAMPWRCPSRALALMFKALRVLDLEAARDVLGSNPLLGEDDVEEPLLNRLSNEPMSH